MASGVFNFLPKNKQGKLITKLYLHTLLISSSVSTAANLPVGLAVVFYYLSFSLSCNCNGLKPYWKKQHALLTRYRNTHDISYKNKHFYNILFS